MVGEGQPSMSLGRRRLYRHPRESGDPGERQLLYTPRLGSRFRGNDKLSETLRRDDSKLPAAVRLVQARGILVRRRFPYLATPTQRTGEIRLFLRIERA